MGAVIDASVLVAAGRGVLDLSNSVSGSAPTRPPIVDESEEVAIAAITLSVLLHGIHRAATPTIKTRREVFVERLLATLTVLPFDSVVARVHARMLAHVSAAGSPAGAYDLEIAATAVAHGCRLITRDERTFSQIPGLEIVRW